MLYYFLYPLSNDFIIFNLLKYITFRGGCALFTSLMLMFYIMPKAINWLKSWQNGGQPIRQLGPESHQTKKGTPTMGGIVMLFSIAISTILWADLNNPYIWVSMMIIVTFGGLGFIDDYLKVKKRNHHGVSGKIKLLGQFGFGLLAIILIQKFAIEEHQTHLAIPFLKNTFIDLGWFYIPFTLFVIIGTSNSVNLTDGLDGLAVVPIMIACASFALISYLVGNVNFATYLQLHYVPHIGEVVILCSAVIGAGLGFLWFNTPPAKIFMGDTGSLACGGLIGTVSVITKHELVLAIIGGVFIMETISVILQVASFKITGKRIFRMAPIHHHFEKKGWSESTVVIRFWILSIIFAILGLATLKIR